MRPITDARPQDSCPALGLSVVFTHMENDPPPLTGNPPPLSQPPSPAPVRSALPAPPRKSRGWKITALILFLLLGVSLFFNLGHVFEMALSIGGHHGRHHGPQLEEAVIDEAEKTKDKIAVINVAGIIEGQGLDGSGFNMVDVIKEQLYRAQDDENVKAVILKVDSPGGEVLASDEIYKAIADFTSASSCARNNCSFTTSTRL